MKTCNVCGNLKPLDEMIAIRRANGEMYVRPRCKPCHNAAERGHRREYKREYLRRWRKRNAELDRSYRDTDRYREQARRRTYKRFTEHHDAVLIQGRMARRGLNVSLEEARELLERYGRCYPTRHGLTPAGLRECERIRSRLRSRADRRMPDSFAIRMMVYEDDDGDYRFVIRPEAQPVPYQSAAENLRRWHRARNEGVRG